MEWLLLGLLVLAFPAVFVVLLRGAVAIVRVLVLLALIAVALGALLILAN